MDHTSCALIHLRTTATRFFLLLLAAHVPLVVVLAAYLDRPLLGPAVTVMALAAAALAAYHMLGVVSATFQVVGVALAGMPAVLVDLLSGHPWQMDLHMYFFAALAMIAIYADVRALLMAAGAIAVHHLGLNFLLPAAVFPSGNSELPRVILHAVIVVLETGVLTWLAHRFAHALVFAETETARTQAALEEVRRYQTEAQEERRRRQDAEKSRREHLAQGFDQTVSEMLGSVGQTVDHVRSASTGLHATADAAQARCSAVAGAAAQSSSMMDLVVCAATQLNAAVDDIDGQVGRSTGIAGAAVRQAEATNATIRSLTDAVQRIGQIVRVIGSIASQTNRLALNATIEAVRAGDAGRGFAIVAHEVKSLATQTAQATDEIARQIAAVHQETQGAVTAIQGISETIGEINSVAAGIAGAVSQQKAATEAIALSIRQAAEGNTVVTRGIVELSDAAIQTAQAAQGMLGLADGLKGEAETLHHEVSRFISAYHG